MRKTSLLLTFIVFLAGGLAGCSNSGTDSAEVQSLKAELQKVKDEKALIENRLVEFDKLDFDYYNNQQWDKLNLSHADNIKVDYPDGSTTDGLYPQHIDRLKPMFVFAPDTKITSHPIRFGSGEWTAVTGEMEGTFSQPMPMGDGKTIPPTGKKFKVSMATIGRWKDTKMSEEHLFWDNQALMKQIGIGN